MRQSAQGAYRCSLGRKTEDVSMPETVYITDHVPFPKRLPDSNKSDYGRVGIIAGCRGMAGAGEMCTRSCLRSGAGLVTIACADCLVEVYETKLTEAMVKPLPDNDGHISAGAWSEILDFISDKDCILFGPGIGRSRDIAELLSHILRSFSGRLVIDADGLFALIGIRDLLRESTATVLITPHVMEMSRLTGTSVTEIKNRLAETAAEFAEEYGIYVLLKDHVSAVAAPDGRVRLNTAGNPGMARGGSGDVLAGVCAGFMCRFSDPLDAASEAALVCGIAGDLAAWQFGMESMLPTDTISLIGRALVEPAASHIKT